ncbi:MAG: hypothetical protein HYT64_00605 [Candidatus Yanofskybacteria bacterium]|nr:hypothetical protein [Candidatus Yanofskybacteria bacterium]
MINIFRRSGKFLTVAVLVSVGAFATIAYASHSWGGYHWARTANPFTLKVGDNVTSTWDGHLGAASNDWSVSSVLDTAVVAGQSDPKRCRPSNGRVEVCNKSYGRNGWLGVASIWVSGSHITQSTVKLNDSYFNTAFYNTPAWRQFVMCQEVGHAFGLDHQDVNFNNTNLGTCMDYTNNPSRNDGLGDNLRPNTHDYDELGIIYQHLDSLTTIFNRVLGKKSATLATINNDGGAEWGKVIRKSSDGRSSLHEKDLGKGDKVFTFVIWAQN